MKNFFVINKKRGLKPLNTAYFAVSLNQHEQFNYFKTYNIRFVYPSLNSFRVINFLFFRLVKWLFQLNEVQAGDYAKYDEPVTVSQNIR
jgi:hypothetical protein